MLIGHGWRFRVLSIDWRAGSIAVVVIGIFKLLFVISVVRTRLHSVHVDAEILGKL